KPSGTAPAHQSLLSESAPAWLAGAPSVSPAGACLNQLREALDRGVRPLEDLDPGGGQHDRAADGVDDVVHDVAPERGGRSWCAPMARRPHCSPTWSAPASATARLRVAASSLPDGTSPFLTIFERYQATHPWLVDAVGWVSFTLAMIST